MIENRSENGPRPKEPFPIDFIRRWGQYRSYECAAFACFNDGAILTIIKNYRFITEGALPQFSDVVIFIASIGASIMMAKEMRREAIMRDHLSNLK